MKSYRKLWGPEIFASILLIVSIFFELDITNYDYKFICSNCICFVSIVSGSLITMTSISMMNLNEQYLKSLKIFAPGNSIRYYFGGPIISGIILSFFSITGPLVIDAELKIQSNSVILKGLINDKHICMTSLWLMLASYFINSSIRSVFLNFEILKVIYELKIGDSKELIKKKMGEVCELLSEK